MVQPPSAATPAETSRHLWRQYWFLVVPVLASVHLSLLLAGLLLAHAIGGGEGGAIGSLGMWFIINAWQARPGAQDTPDWRTHGQRHIPGVVTVQRPHLTSATRAPGTGRAPAAELEPGSTQASTGSPREDVYAIAWVAFIVAVDVTVLAVLLITTVWAFWVAALAGLLLAAHMWLSYRVVRGAGRRLRASKVPHDSPTRSAP